MPFLNDRKVEFIFELFKGNPFLRGNEAAVESIFTNLLNNSLFWLESANINERKIIIRTQESNNSLTIQVFDNGPGIEGVNKDDIWLPGVTTRSNGTGLGLTILHDAVKDLSGNVDVVEHGELGGAEFIIELPIIGV